MAKKKVKKKAVDLPTFEEALNRLEQIVHQLEEGDLGLQESLDRYKEGVGLLRQSHDLLGQAERQIELLTKIDAEGNSVTQPWDDPSSSLEEKGEQRSRRRTSE